MKKLIVFTLWSLLITPFSIAQTGWFIEPSFTSQNIYDCKSSAIGGMYAVSDNGKIFNSINNGYNWTLYNFNDPLLNNSSFKFIMGQSNDNWSAVGTNCALGYKFAPVDSVLRIASSPQPDLEAYSYLSGYFFYSAYSAAGAGGNFYLKDSQFWRKDTAATRVAGGRNINYSHGNIFVGDNGLIMKADTIGIVHSNGERIKWRKIPSGTTKNLYSVFTTSGLTYMAVGQDGVILKTTNAGETWHNVASPVTTNLYSVWFGYGYLICGENGTILRSYDPNLNTWYKQNSPTTEDLYIISTLSYSMFIAMGRNGIMLRTLDGGGSLKRIVTNSFIEGFYNPVTNLMVSDTITVKVRAAIFPYNVISTAKEKLSIYGSALIGFGPEPLDSVPYYIQVNHRNSLEVWSSSTPIFAYNDMYYDFYPLASKAFGNNQKKVDTSPVVKYALYSGDINQDGAIDASDLSNVENDAGNSLSGYVNTDVNGDDFVDAADLSIVENNVQLGIYVAAP